MWVFSGRLFSGEGSSKKDAKHNMAHNAIVTLMPMANIPLVAPPKTTTVKAEGSWAPIKNGSGEEGGTPNTPKMTKMASSKKSSVGVSEKHHPAIRRLLQLTKEKGPEFKPDFQHEDVSAPEAKPHERLFKFVIMQLF